MWQARLSELEFDEKELTAVLDTLDSEWITAGPRTQSFEKSFASMTGAAHAVAVSNGTAALFLALKALDIGPGDEVLCPSLTFVATAAAIMHCGATPVFVDICSLEDPTMDPVDAASKITERTRAILPMHYAGIPANMSDINVLADAHNLTVVEDAAHAPGARYAGRGCGSFGAAGCFSFFGNKNITTGEGGMITTNDPALAERLRLLRSHGMTVTSWDREKGRPSHYDVLEIGFNFRFDDIRAAIGLVQLEKLEGFNAHRRNLVTSYNRRIKSSGLDLTLPFAWVPSYKKPSYHVYPVLLENEQERNRMEESLRMQGIQTSIHYKPVHTFSAFRKLQPGVSLPITEAFAARELTLPLYPSMTENQIDTIVSSMVHCRGEESASHGNYGPGRVIPH